MTDNWKPYFGIPYREKGRDRTGLDCWGLVRLVYAERYGIELPSLAGEYEARDDGSIADTIAREKEGWEPVKFGKPGDVAVFRIAGEPHHVGIITSPGYFLHVRRDGDSVRERLDSPMWKHRLEGIYRYVGAGMPTKVSACPHPLTTARIDTELPSGLTLNQMSMAVRQAGSIHADIPDSAIIWVDGEYIPREQWADYVPKPGAMVEYRAVAGDDAAGKLIGTIAIAGLAWWAAPAIAGAMGFASNGLASAMISGAINMAGGMLLNSIFPTRPPGAGNNPGSAAAMAMLQGGSNQANPYGAMPVVLGRYRFTPPLGALTYSVTSGSKSYLHMLLAVGFGPLQLSNVTIGDTPYEKFEEVEAAILNGWDDTPEDKADFNRLYGKDVSQEIINTKLTCTKKTVTSASRASNVVTVNTSGDHGYGLGAHVKLYCSRVVTEVTPLAWPQEDQFGNVITEITTTTTVYEVVAFGLISEVVDSDTFKFTHAGSDGAIANTEWVLGSTYVERVISDACDRITMTFLFPEGLRRVSVEGKKAGEVSATMFRGIAQVRQIDPDTLAPLSSWGDIDKAFYSKKINLPPAWYNTDSDAALEKVYRWTRISVSPRNVIIVRHGAFTTNPAANPTGALLARLQAENFGLNVEYSRLPDLDDGEEELWQICVYGNDVVSTVDRRGTGTGGVTGGGLTYSGLVATVAGGEIARALSENIRLGNSGEEYVKRKDAFSYTVTFDVPNGKYEVRAARTNDDAKDGEFSSGNKFQRLHDCYFYAATGYENRAPIAFPKPLAKIALRIKATDQFNGNVDGIQVTATSICLDYDYTTDTWIKRPTRNPASLYRYVLQHPANVKRLTDSQIDLDHLATWHTFCRVNGFMFDTVLTGQQSVEDVLRDIAAAGRASPGWNGAKRSVVIDNERTDYVQFFTPRNSWDFSGTRILPKLPHGWRVQFVNAAKGYQPDERKVYADGYSESNATLFEGLSLPGVCTDAAVFKHARMHFANLKLQPETYTLHAARENLLCTRGDLVGVAHHVISVGLATARIKQRLDGTHIVVDGEFQMDAGVAYAIQIRLADGSTVSRSLDNATTDGYYTELTLLSSVTTTQAAAGNLVLFGKADEVFADMIVQHVEYLDHMHAKLTLKDYSPARFESDSEALPAFDSNVTKAPGLLVNVISQKPTLGTPVSNESVMQRVAPGIYRYAIQVPFSNPQNLPSRITHVQAEMDWAEDASLNWENSVTVPLAAKSVRFDDAIEGDAYRIRMRYVDVDGRTGPWTVAITHTVAGRINPPSTITGLAVRVSGDRLLFDWPDAEEPDVTRYEARLVDADWGVADGNRVYFGGTSSCFYRPSVPGEITLYFRKRDDAGNWSATASISYTYEVPSVTGLLINDNKVSWSVPTSSFPIDGYRLRFNDGYDREWGNAVPVHDGLIKSSPYILSNRPSGQVTFLLKLVDALGNESPEPAWLVANMGDALSANILQTFDFKAGGFAGTKTHCSVVSGDLVADASSLFYRSDASAFFGQSSAPFYPVDTYYGLDYITDGFKPSPAASGIAMLLSKSVIGSSPAIYYRLTGPQQFFGAELDEFFGSDADDFYSGPSAWALWPGSLAAINDEYQLRVTTAAGTVQGKITAMTASIDVPDKIVRLNDVAIAAGGTRLTSVIGQFASIKNIQITLQNSTADRVYAEDKSAALGPMIKATAAGVGVTAIVDITLQGHQ